MQKSTFITQPLMMMMSMRRFENLLYLFAGIAVGMLMAATLYEKEIQKIYSTVQIPKTSDITDDANDYAKGYYEHLIKTK
jgi:hypothetical protein